jgi:hypothetical protein
LFVEEKPLPKPDFEKLLLEAIDEGLSSLGNSPKEAIYFHLDRSFNIKKEQIPGKIEAFENAIENIFGIGANFLEIIIMKQLYRKVGGAFELNETARLAFAEYVATAKRAFQEKKETQTTEVIVECEEVRTEV